MGRSDYSDSLYSSRIAYCASTGTDYFVHDADIKS